MELKEIIKQKVCSMLKEDQFLVEVEVQGGGMKKVTVIVDADTGMGIDDCSRISRMLGEELEKENLISTAYVLEVTSPGIDHPLSSVRQYRKNIGRKIQVLLQDGKIKTGTLKEVMEDRIVIDAEEKEKGPTGKPGKRTIITPAILPFTEIKKSNVLVSFN